MYSCLLASLAPKIRYRNTRVKLTFVFGPSGTLSSQLPLVYLNTHEIYIIITCCLTIMLLLTLISPANS